MRPLHACTGLPRRNPPLWHQPACDFCARWPPPLSTGPRPVPPGRRRPPHGRGSPGRAAGDRTGRRRPPRPRPVPVAAPRRQLIFCGVDAISARAAIWRSVARRCRYRADGRISLPYPQAAALDCHGTPVPSGRTRVELRQQFAGQADSLKFRFATVPADDIVHHISAAPPGELAEGAAL